MHFFLNLWLFLFFTGKYSQWHHSVLTLGVPDRVCQIKQVDARDQYCNLC